MTRAAPGPGPGLKPGESEWTWTMMRAMTELAMRYLCLDKYGRMVGTMMWNTKTCRF